MLFPDYRNINNVTNMFILAVNLTCVNTVMCTHMVDVSIQGIFS